MSATFNVITPRPPAARWQPKSTTAKARRATYTAAAVADQRRAGCTHVPFNQALGQGNCTVRQGNGMGGGHNLRRRADLLRWRVFARVRFAWTGKRHRACEQRQHGDLVGASQVTL